MRCVWSAWVNSRHWRCAIPCYPTKPVRPTMPSEPAVSLLAGDERRLHPLSWLFVLLAQLRQFALPLIVLVFAGGRGDRWEWIGALGALALPLIAVVQDRKSTRLNSSH